MFVHTTLSYFKFLKTMRVFLGKRSLKVQLFRHSSAFLDSFQRWY